MKIDSEQSRKGYTRKGYTATRGDTQYRIPPTRVGGSKSSFSKIVEVPSDARNMRFHKGKLPSKYQSALQRVR